MYHVPPHVVNTNVGRIAAYVNHVPSGGLPIIFLHGVYFDHHLWDYQIASLRDRTTIAIDMPLHGSSRSNIKNTWTLHDCANMLIEVLDTLDIPQVIAVGHSWGSMTILRAAHKHPERFSAAVLCNMPLFKASRKQVVKLRLGYPLMVFRDFYSTQAGKALFGKSSLRDNPTLIRQLKRSMDLLSNEQIQQVDRAVIVEAEDASRMVANLRIKAVALKGEEDYVPILPGNIETVIVPGGHVSPLEQPARVLELLLKLL